MDKLTIKELTPYLPYGLKFLETGFQKIKEMDGIDSSIIYFKDDMGNYFDEIKPILHPLSDLTSSNVSKVMRKYFCNEIEIERDLQKIGMLVYNPVYCSYSIIEALLSEHFDVFGLIEKGLAIDINTLK